MARCIWKQASSSNLALIGLTGRDRRKTGTALTLPTGRKLPASGTATGIATSADIRSVAHSQLRVIVFPDSPKAWTARSLERDLAARGATPDAAIDSLIRIAQAHVEFDTRHGRVPLSAFAPAPRLYWNAFARADNVHSVTMCRPERDLSIQCSVARLPEHPIIARYDAQVRSA